MGTQDMAHPAHDREPEVEVGGPDAERHARRQSWSRRWLSEKDRSLLTATLWMAPVPLVGALITLLAVGLFVTPDGGGYITLGQVIKDGQFPDVWDFVREPGLPLLVRVTALSHYGVQSYLFVSGFLAGTAIALTGGVFYDLGRNWQRLVAGLLAVSASVYISYAGYLMQQIGFAFLLALLGWNLRLIQTADGVKPLRLLSLGCVGALSLYYGAIFTPIVALALILAAVVIARRLGGLSRRMRGWSLAALLLAFIIPVAVYAPWYSLKAQSAAASVSGLSGAALPGNESRMTYVRDRLGTSLLLLQLKGAAESVRVTEYAGTSGEDIRWAILRDVWPDQDPQCGILDVYPKVKEQIRFRFGYREYCTPFDGSGYLANTAQASYYLGGATSLIMIVGTVWAFFRRRALVPVLLLPWAWVGVYTFTAPIDRYGIPIWPYKTMFASLLVFGCATWVIDRFRRRAGAGVSSPNSVFPGEEAEAEDGLRNPEPTNVPGTEQTISEETPHAL